MSDSMLYVAMNGASATTFAQAINSNNLANVNTPGFKGDLFHAEQVYVDSGKQETTYTGTATSYSDFTPGTMMATERELDVAIQGKGWFAVQAADGSEAYTRAGNFQLNSLGQLTTANGLSVMGGSNTITIPPSSSIKIAVDGTISVRASGQSAAAMTVIDKLKLVNPDTKNLVKGMDGLFRLKTGEVATVDNTIKVESGALEGSNVNAVDALVNIINLGREFELEVKLMNQNKENGHLSAQLLQT